MPVRGDATGCDAAEYGSLGSEPGKCSKHDCNVAVTLRRDEPFGGGVQQRTPVETSKPWRWIVGTQVDESRGLDVG
jgi:hypothetical protein